MNSGEQNRSRTSAQMTTVEFEAAEAVIHASLHTCAAGFVQLVADMRAMQKLYFQRRNQTALVNSKRLEKEVDKFIDHWMEANEG